MADVIRFLRRKGAGNVFESPTYLGAEQRFVGPLRSGGVNNLEEQYILGTNTYTESYLDEEGNGVVEKIYCDTDSEQSNYYKVISTYYVSDPYYKSFFCDDDALYLPYGLELGVFDSGSDFFVEREEFNENYPTTFTPIREDKLFYYNGQQDIPVLTKTIEVKYVDNGVTIKKVTKENIENHLVD